MKSQILRLGGALAVVLALVAAAGLSGTTSAAPKEGGKNVEVIPVDCDSLGSFDIISKFNAATAFGPDGEVFVAKRIVGSSEVTFSVENGPTWSETEAFDEGGQGNGYQDRLTACDFTEEFHEQFTLDERTVEFLGLDPEFVGSTITIDGTFNGTAWVSTPGR
jgi:hypothetical protein